MPGDVENGRLEVHVSPEVGRLLDASVAVSVRRGHFYVGVDHVFEALLEQAEDLPRAFVKQYGATLERVLGEVLAEEWQGDRVWEGSEVFYTPRVANITTQAGKLAERFGAGKGASAGHLLLALLADAHAAPSRAIDRRGVNRGEMIEALRRELSRGNGRGAPAGAAPSSVAAPTAQPAEEGPREGPANGVLESLTRDLTAAARAGALQPAVGRDSEIFEVLQVLARKNKNNVMLLGEAGVGKTQLVEGLALAAAKKRLEGVLPGARVLELKISALMGGTQYRGALEEKLSNLLDALRREKNAVLFIDEAHLIMGAGASNGDSVDVANLLKPALARGELRCIGATTFEEYRKFISKDPAIERRFQVVRVEPLGEEATLEVLGRLKSSFEKHHKVRISSRTLDAVVRLTQRYMPNRHLPDKAIDVLDQACARHRLKAIAARNAPAMLEGTMVPQAVDKVLPHDVRKVISQITAIPIEEMTAEERRMLTNLDQSLKARIIGQDEAVFKTAAAVKKSRAGLGDPNRPDAILLFIGPTGVGKSQLAKAVAEQLFGSSEHLVSFDMSEYVDEQSVSRLVGAAPGLVGSEEEGLLTQAVRNAPFSVLLFDEIEKAHARVFDILLPVFDEGRLKDNRGREVSFRNCIIILTSNIGAERLSAGPPASLSELMGDLRGHFRPEFINRVDEIVPFYPLLFEDIREILGLYLRELHRRLREKGIGVRVYQGAYEYLAQEGYNEDFGARELRRTLEQLVVNPLSDLIVRGTFRRGDIVEVLMEDDRLDFRKGKPRERGEGGKA